MRKRMGLRAQVRLYNSITREIKAAAKRDDGWHPNCGCPVNAPEADHTIWACPCGSHCQHLECIAEAKRRACLA